VDGFSVERLMNLLTALDRDPSTIMSTLSFGANRDRARLGALLFARLRDGIAGF
jgi:hypothetical protein